MSKQRPDAFRLGMQVSAEGFAAMRAQARGLHSHLDLREKDALANLETFKAKADKYPDDVTIQRLLQDLEDILFRVGQARKYGVSEQGMLAMERLGYAAARAKMRLAEAAIDSGQRTRAANAERRRLYSKQRRDKQTECQEFIDHLWAERSGTASPRGHRALCEVAAKKLELHADTIRKCTANPNRYPPEKK